MRALIRKMLPLGGKEAVANLLGSAPIIWPIRCWTGNVVRHHGTRIDVSDPRITDYTVASLVWKYYERAEVDLIRTWSPRAGDVIELGGSIGVVTMLIASRLDAKGRLVSIEADPELCAVAERSRKLNPAGEKVSIVNAAIDYNGDTVRFGRGSATWGGKLDQDGTADDQIVVPARTLSSIVKDHGLKAYTLIMDIEGAEWQILKRPEELADCVRIIAELHQIDDGGRTITVDYMIEQFTALGFRLVDRDGVSVVMDRAPSAP